MKQVVIVGGGASGTLVAMQLLKISTGIEVVVIEPSPNLGAGAAYGTNDPNHLLNVPAENMTADPALPDDFVDWAKTQEPHAENIRTAFMPRRMYGDYLRFTLARALGNNSNLRHIQAKATSLHRTPVGLQVGLDNGPSQPADQVVLALGNLPPRLLPAFKPIQDNPRFIEYPWAPSCYGGIQNHESVLILGSGLTMLDAVMTLVAKGHQGKIFVRSRRGLMPHPHAPLQAIKPELGKTETLFRDVIKACRNAGSNWRGVMQGLRPQTIELWQSLTWEQRDLFFRRLSLYWDIHRHRAPVPTMNAVSDLTAKGQFNIAKGSLKSVIAQENGFEVELTSEKITVNHIVNCTGPNGGLQQAKLPILESASQDDLLKYDPLGMGLLIDSKGRTNPQGDVWAIGPLCKGCWLETTAIPEIRVQALRIAEAITS